MDDVHPAVQHLLDTTREVFGSQVTLCDERSADGCEAPPRGGVPNLDRWTHNPRSKYPEIPKPRPNIIPHAAPHGGAYDEISVTKFDDGSGEFSVIKRPGWYNPNHHRGHKRKQKAQQRDDMDPIVAKRSAYRAKKAARYGAIQLGITHMYSFTFAENITDMDIAKKVWETFVTRYRRLTPYKFRIGPRPHHVTDFEYICVPEYQKRGAIHFHALVHGANDIRRLRSEWMSAQRVCGMKDLGDQVNARYYRTHSDRHKAIAYASKYITKAFEDGMQYSKRYFRSKGIPKPKRERYFTMDDLGEDDVRDLMESEYHGRVVWLCLKKVGPFEMYIGKFTPW